MTETKYGKLIHIGFIQIKGKGTVMVLLRQTKPLEYRWFEEINEDEVETTLFSDHSEEALRLGINYWKDDFFRTLNCGFRYSLPERDEHGVNALFHQMAASYSSSNGIYFDEEVGSNCIVHNASLQARGLLNKLQQEARI